MRGYGYCECGCGQKASISHVNDKTRGYVKGKPVRFLPGHNAQQGDPRWKETAGNPAGLCGCGCGRKTPLAKTTDPRVGHVKGKPLRFVRGHHRRKSPTDYVIENRGYETPCWIWQGAVVHPGYGQMRRDGRRVMAHRFYYEREHGPVPDGLELDHLCRVYACVNPDHLEPVTHAVNMSRAAKARMVK